MTAPIAATRVITLSQFEKVLFVIGKAVSLCPNPSAKIPAYLIQLDFGGPLKGEHKAISKKEYYTSSAQLCSNHTVDEITNNLILTVLNFPRKQIGKMMSDCLVTGVQKATGTPEEKRFTTVFMTPSAPVEVGSQVGILGNKVFLEKNPRDLSFEEFSLLDLIIGTLETCISCVKLAEETKKVMLGVNLGEQGIRTCVGILKSEIKIESLIGKQVLVLSNLDEESKKKCFGNSDAQLVLCTIGAESVLHPKKTVENGFKLA